MNDAFVKISDLKTYQKYLLGMLVFFDEFCFYHNINYSLIDGTLLGAARDGKVIEWDDDIDICLTRDNLDKLINSFKEYDGRYHLNLISERPFKRNGKRDFVFIHTQLVDKKCSSQRYNIDIFTVDYLGNDYRIAKKAIKKSIFYWKLFTIGPTFHKPTIKKFNTFRKNFINLIVIIFFPIFWIVHFVLNKAIVFFYLKYEKKFLSYDEDSKYYTIEPFLGRFGISSDNIVSDGYSRLTLNGYSFMVFSKFKLYLEKTYGDYMTPPPEKDRKPEHSMIWKTPIIIEDDLQLNNRISKIKI